MGEQELEARVRAVTQGPTREEQDAHDEVVKGRGEERSLEALAAGARVVGAEVGGAVAEERLGPVVVGKPGGTRREQWEVMLGVYREGGSHAEAAKKAGVTKEAARRAWGVGVKSQPWGQVSIAKLLEGEARDARAVAAKKMAGGQGGALIREIEAAEFARAQAVEARADEAMALAMGRKVAKSLLASQLAMVPGLRKVAEAVNDRLAELVAEGQPKMGWKEIEKALKVVEQSSTVLRNLAASTEQLVETERLLMGQPGKTERRIAMTLEQALVELAKSKSTLDMVEQGRTEAGETREFDITAYRFKPE